MTAGRDVQYIVIHCAATKPSMDIGAQEIDSWHKAKGWRMIGYHLVIRRSGEIEIGRPLDDDHVLGPNEVGAHVEGYNSISVGVCLVGGINDAGDPENNFTPAQMQSLVHVVEVWRQRFPTAKVVGHTDLNPHKACPSFDVAAWLKSEGL